MTATINHHLTEDVLLAYSAGTLPEAFNLMVAAHLSLCDECRARAEGFDVLGGALLDDDAAEDVSLGSDALSQTLALIAGGAPEQAPRKFVKDGILPQPIQDYVGGDLDAINWRPVGMGVKQAILSTSNEASARLLYIPAGAAMPDHGHRGIEMTMVLKGAFLDDGERFARGDVEMADCDLEHTPVADIGEDCICLAVSDAPLRFNSLIPRLVQPFLRI
jgi:putative transcriptional regulator